MQIEQTQFEKVDSFVREFGLVEKLWLGRRDWQQNSDRWEIQPFFEIDIEDITNKIEKLSKLANNCAKEMETNEVSRIFKQQIEDFKNSLSLLHSLRDPALTEEPWEEVRNLLLNGEEVGFF